MRLNDPSTGQLLRCHAATILLADSVSGVADLLCGATVRLEPCQCPSGLRAAVRRSARSTLQRSPTGHRKRPTLPGSTPSATPALVHLTSTGPIVDWAPAPPPAPLSQLGVADQLPVADRSNLTTRRALGITTVGVPRRGRRRAAARVRRCGRRPTSTERRQLGERLGRLVTTRPAAGAPSARQPRDDRC